LTDEGTIFFVYPHPSSENVHSWTFSEATFPLGGKVLTPRETGIGTSDHKRGGVRMYYKSRRAASPQVASTPGAKTFGIYAKNIANTLCICYIFKVERNF